MWKPLTAPARGDPTSTTPSALSPKCPAHVRCEIHVLLPRLSVPLVDRQGPSKHPGSWGDLALRKWWLWLGSSLCGIHTPGSGMGAHEG